MNNCPKCASEALVETPAMGNIPLDVCPGCSGIWFDKGELEAMLKQSQGGVSADFDLINPKAEGLACPRCKNKMSRGGLVNPLLVVDKCPSCGGIWLDPHELDLLRKLLGLSGGPSAETVYRPAVDPAAPLKLDAKFIRIKIVSAVGAVAGLIGVSYEMYLYLSPAAAVSHAPSAGLAAASVLLFAGGVLAMNWGKGKGW
ncbi:MAG: zf-TFIIB domain-containing protein [Elusimicrobiota bacterium]|nr:zf-TFIIB domain-containing protein [Elusimicrobiota bacterium]